MSLRLSLGLHSMMISTTEATVCLQCCSEQRTVCFKACMHSVFSVGLLEGRLRIRSEHLQRQPMAQSWGMFSEYSKPSHSQVPTLVLVTKCMVKIKYFLSGRLGTYLLEALEWSNPFSCTATFLRNIKGTW